MSGSGFPHELQGGRTGIPFFKVSDLQVADASGVVSLASNYVEPSALRQLGAAVVPPGSILMPKIGAAIQSAQRRVRVGVRAAFDNNVLALVPERVDARFLQYWLGQLDLRPLSQPGAVASLDMVGFRALRLPALARDRQREVGEFLDREGARLADLQAACARFEAEAFAPALARFADLTEPWPTGRVGYRFSVQLGKMLDQKRIGTGQAHPYLRNSNVQWDRMALGDLKQMTFSPTERRKYELRAGDLLVCEGGQPGRSAVWDGSVPGCYFQKALMRLRPRAGDSTRFLMWCLRLAAARGDFAADGTGSTILHLPAERLVATRIPLPPADAQRAIQREVDDLAARVSGMAREAASVRALLVEYRDAVITEAVTGQLDVTKIPERQRDESAHAAVERERPEVLSA